MDLCGISQSLVLCLGIGITLKTALPYISSDGMIKAFHKIL
jgi:hypothetical protein